MITTYKKEMKKSLNKIVEELKIIALEDKDDKTVCQFGCVGDGVTDCTVAAQSALDYSERKRNERIFKQNY